jgi:hypothetical protein
LLIIKKGLINIRSLFEQIYPSELCKIINKAYIIGMFSQRKRSRAPYIREHMFQRNSGYTSGYGIWKLMTLS